jgi:hypothetical protein
MNREKALGKCFPNGMLGAYEQLSLLPQVCVELYVNTQTRDHSGSRPKMNIAMYGLMQVYRHSHDFYYYL